jgi:hypothetical protein
MTPYYELGSTTPDYTCSNFDSIRREVAQNKTRDDYVTLADMMRCDLIELFHPDPDVLNLEAVTWDGRVIGTWGGKPQRPIKEYYRDPIDAERARERMEAAECISQ